MSVTQEQPKPTVKNTLQAITRLRSPHHSQEWGVFAYALNSEILTDGKLDELYGLVFPLGSFSTKEEAETHAKNIVATTLHPGVVVAKYATPFPLSSGSKSENEVEKVKIDAKGKIIEMDKTAYEKEKALYEKRIALEKEIEEEAKAETDPNSVEHYKRSVYLAIKNREAYNFYTKQAEEAKQLYEKRLADAKAHYAAHPEHESEWLPILKDRLLERGESTLYNQIEAGYTTLRPEIVKE